MVWDGISTERHMELPVIRGGSMTAVRYLQEISELIIQAIAAAVGQACDNWSGICQQSTSFLL